VALIVIIWLASATPLAMLIGHCALGEEWSAASVSVRRVAFVDKEE
jgi:hypothetical protein